MSDYRDPRDPHDPLHRDPAYDSFNSPAARHARAQAYSPGMAIAWFVGIALFIGVMIYAFGTGDSQQVAETDTTPPATQTQPATPPAATPPAQNPATKPAPSESPTPPQQQ